jgi:ectoine hydroxylase-related dioxygenase (phytanoyl-CoA dioxygenase family)
MEDDYVQRIRQAAIDLKEKGYAVLKRVYSREQADEVYDAMWQCFDKASGGVLNHQADYASMKASALPDHRHGILQSYRINHAEPCRQVRRDPRILKVFAALYGTDQLTGSMDRINFKFPGRRYRSQEDWPHIDQDPRLVGRVSIQSYLTLTDSGEEAPDNRLYEGSHLIFAEHWAYRRGDGPVDNWVRLTDKEAKRLEKQCPLVKPVLAKGDMLLWDSRTAHSPSDGADFQDGRFVIYLCYNKLWEKAGDAKFASAKKDAFINCRATPHSPVPQTLFPKGPRIYDAEKPPAYWEFTKEQLGIGDEPQGCEKHLFCFESYEGREGLNLGLGWKDEFGPVPLLDFVSPFTPLLPAYEEPKNEKNEKKRRTKKDIDTGVSKKKAKRLS